MYHWPTSKVCGKFLGKKGILQRKENSRLKAEFLEISLLYLLRDVYFSVHGITSKKYKSIQTAMLDWVCALNGISLIPDNLSYVSKGTEFIYRKSYTYTSICIIVNTRRCILTNIRYRSELLNGLTIDQSHCWCANKIVFMQCIVG